MRILGTIIQIPTLPMFQARENLPLSGSVAHQFVGDEDAWYVRTALQELGCPSYNTHMSWFLGGGEVEGAPAALTAWPR